MERTGGDINHRRIHDCQRLGARLRQERQREQCACKDADPHGSVIADEELLLRADPVRHANAEARVAEADRSGTGQRETAGALKQRANRQHRTADRDRRVREPVHLTTEPRVLEFHRSAYARVEASLGTDAERESDVLM